MSTLLSSGTFSNHLERDRKNSARTRNLRLVAIRSFFKYVAMREPAHSGLIQRVLAIPQKRFDRNLVTFLAPAESKAFIAAPDRTTWIGRRDHALLVVATETGLRVSEAVHLRQADVDLQAGLLTVRQTKFDKSRYVPLHPSTTAALRRSTFSLRQAASRTSTVSGFFSDGPMTSKSRLTSSSG